MIVVCFPARLQSCLDTIGSLKISQNWSLSSALPSVGLSSCYSDHVYFLT